jgi:hypothetical protein
MLPVSQRNEKRNATPRSNNDKGAEVALRNSPLLIILRRSGVYLADGFHRAMLAVHKFGLTELPAVVGKPRERRHGALAEATFRAPRTLYHGTDPKLLPMIQKEGLLMVKDTSWIEFGAGVYLAMTIEQARSYGSIVLAVKVLQLDKGRLAPDDYELRDHFQNDQDGDDKDEDGPTGIYEATWLDSLRIVGQCQYLGDIPPSALTVVKQKPPVDPRHHYRIDFRFTNGKRDMRTLDMPPGSEDSIRSMLKDYFAGDERGTAEIVSVKDIGLSSDS